jgi:hypothetical protein
MSTHLAIALEEIGGGHRGWLDSCWCCMGNQNTSRVDSNYTPAGLTRSTRSPLTVGRSTLFE